MKPNGRRAWRKWLKSQRKHDKDSWAANNGWFFVRFDGVQMTVSVIRQEIEKVEE